MNGKRHKVWVPGETVEAVAYDNPIPGYGTRNTINLRLWAAKPSNQFDLEAYNTGDYINSVVNRQRAETISNVLYPDDRSHQDIIRRFKEEAHNNFDELPEKVHCQIFILDRNNDQYLHINLKGILGWL